MSFSRMRSPDFLHKDADTRLGEHYLAAGAVCKLSTNSEQLLQAARETFFRTELPHRPIDFTLRFWVDDADRCQPPWPAPYVRGLDHLVFAGFGETSSLLADLRTRRVIGRFSPSMAADRAYCKAVIFPMLLTIISATVGIAELHCACVASNDAAVLLAGPSGAGKSTLALALSQDGFGFVSDDRTFCSLEDGAVQVWGLPTELKLRPESALWFQELQEMPVSDTRGGKPAFWLDPEHLNGVTRVRRCRPTSLIFLERQDAPRFRWSPMSSAEALNRLEQGILAEFPEATAKRSETLQKVAALPCWLLQYGGRPQVVARQISRYLAKY